MLTGNVAMLLAMNKTVNVAEFKDRFSELLALVEQGAEVIVCRRNVPLARVEPIRKPTPRQPARSVLGCMKGTVRIHGNLTEPCIPQADWEMLK
jgi:prevent-host-death family protein